jgi:hypothetical protein
MSPTKASHDAPPLAERAAEANEAADTVKLDAAALRKLVVATVLTVDDSGPMAAAPDGPPAGRSGRL